MPDLRLNICRLASSNDTLVRIMRTSQAAFDTGVTVLYNNLSHKRVAYVLQQSDKVSTHVFKRTSGGILVVSLTRQDRYAAYSLSVRTLRVTEKPRPDIIAFIY
jgi:predicted RNA-binding protein YlxR (DUF448 family)